MKTILLALLMASSISHAYDVYDTDVEPALEPSEVRVLNQLPKAMIVVKVESAMAIEDAIGVIPKIRVEAIACNSIDCYSADGFSTRDLTRHLNESLELVTYKSSVTEQGLELYSLLMKAILKSENDVYRYGIQLVEDTLFGKKIIQRKTWPLKSLDYRMGSSESVTLSHKDGSTVVKMTMAIH